jgi:hypothetical protein
MKMTHKQDCICHLCLPGTERAATANQPPPTGTGAEIAPLVMADIQARIQKGKATYGDVLRTGNGRNALWDAYQEALDLALYLRQAIEEQG